MTSANESDSKKNLIYGIDLIKKRSKIFPEFYKNFLKGKCLFCGILPLPNNKMGICSKCQKNLEKDSENFDQLFFKLEKNYGNN